MYEKVEKSKKTKSTSVNNSITQKKTDAQQGSDIIDNRKEATAQRKLLKTMNAPKSKNTKNSKNIIPENAVQCMSWQESKSLQSGDYNDPTSDGVSGGEVWMYVLKHKTDSYRDIRVHFHAGSSKGSKKWTVRWNNEGSGKNIATQKWMRDRVNTYYESNQK